MQFNVNGVAEKMVFLAAICVPEIQNIIHQIQIDRLISKCYLFEENDAFQIKMLHFL